MSQWLKCIRYFLCDKFSGWYAKTLDHKEVVATTERVKIDFKTLVKETLKAL